MIGATFCSGIGAPEAAAPWVDWRFASEIEPFPRAVLAERFGYRDPEAQNQGEPLLWGDMQTVTPDLWRDHGLPLPELIVAGTPCQAFSVAGMRRGLDDDRGNLTLKFVEIVHDIVAARHDGQLVVLWENVPGVLSDKGNAFGAFLGGIVGASDAFTTPDGESWPSAGMVEGPRARAAWRVLDAQYFGVAQRRRRVFVVIDFGNRVDPAQILFERQGLQGNSAPRRETGEDIAGTLGGSSQSGGFRTTDLDNNGAFVVGHHGDVAGTVTAKWAKGPGGPAGDETQNMVAFDCKGSEVQHDADADKGDQDPVVAFDLRGREGGALPEGPHDTANLRAASGGSSRSYVQAGPIVRRLTPVECARLQGFNDDHCQITYRGRPAADGPQYKAYGNSMAVPVVAWILDRIRASASKQGE